MAGSTSFNSNNLTGADGKRLSCSGSYETTTGLYQDVILVGSDLLKVSFLLLDSSLLTFKLTQAETLQKTVLLNAISFNPAQNSKTIFSPQINDSSANFLLGTDLVVSANKEVRDLINPKQTTAIINDNETPLSQFVLDPNFSNDGSLNKRLIKNNCLKSEFLNTSEISELIEYGLFKRAKEEIGKINNSDSFELEARLNFLLFNAQIAAAENQPETALRWLENPLTAEVDPLSEIGRELFLLKGQTYLALEQPELALSVFTEITESWPIDLETSLYENLWHSLQSLDERRLSQIAEESKSYELRGWIELARIFRSEETSLKKQLEFYLFYQ